MIRRPPRSTRVRSSAASDVYKRQYVCMCVCMHVCTYIYIHTQRKRESVCACDLSSGTHTHILTIYIHTNTSKTYEHRYTMLIRLACAAIGPPTPRVPCRASRQTYTARRWSHDSSTAGNAAPHPSPPRQRKRSQGRTGAPCRALPAHTLSQQLLLASQLQRHPARVLVRGCYISLKLMLDLRSRTVLPAG